MNTDPRAQNIEEVKLFFFSTLFTSRKDGWGEGGGIRPNPPDNRYTLNNNLWYFSGVSSHIMK